LFGYHANYFRQLVCSNVHSDIACPYLHRTGIGIMAEEYVLGDMLRKVHVLYLRG
jgi:hypothetical protein